MSTVRHSPYPAPTPSIASPTVMRADGQFEELRALVDRAQNGEIDLDIGARTDPPSDAHGKLPSGWYAPLLPEAPRPRHRPEVVAGVLGLCAGLVLLIPLALWWQYSSSNGAVPVVDVRAVATPSTLIQTPAARVDIVPVRTQSLTRTVESPTLNDVRDLLNVGEVIAARSLLTDAVAAREPEALFLMAETYNPNMLAAWGARGVGADPDRARGLYAAAEALGHDKARARLQGLR